MGKKAKWLSGVKNPFKSSPNESAKVKENVAIINHSKETGDQPKNEKTKRKDKRRWSFGKSNQTGSPAGKMPPSTMQDNSIADEQKGRPLAEAIATVGEAEMAHLNSETWCLSNNKSSTVDTAAIKIQTAFRGYVARKTLRALRGVVRLQALIRGHTVQKQSVTTLRCVQALVRVQARVRARRVRMSEEGQAAQRQLRQRREQEMVTQKQESEEGETQDWDDSARSIEEVEAKKLIKQEAAIKRERALAYAFAHQQWRPSPNQASTDLEKPQWGWSLLERWMAARPWDYRSFDKDASEISADAHDSAFKTLRVDSGKPASPNGVLGKEGMVSTTQQQKTAEEDGSLNGGGPKNSKAGSVFTDDESLGSLSALPNYMVSTKSAQAKARRSVSNPKHRPMSAERKQMLSLANKRLSYPATGRSDAGHLSMPMS